jgi:hypothetical protein
MRTHTHTWGFEDDVKGYKTERKEKWWEHTKIIHEICNQTPHFGIAIQVWALKSRGSYISMVLWGIMRTLVLSRKWILLNCAYPDETDAYIKLATDLLLIKKKLATNLLN